MRVAIAVCYDKENYGSMLQAYATQEYLEGKGLIVTTLDKSGLRADISVGRRKYYTKNALNLSLLKAKMGFVLHRVRQRFSRAFAVRVAERHIAFREFAGERFNLSPRFLSFGDLSSYCEQFDVVVVGSDQLWLPVNIAGDYYTLSFVPETVRTISYATSFGISQLPDSFKEMARAFLIKIDYVSVREDSGQKIIKEVAGRAAEVVCDPTMLLTPSQWQSIEEETFEIPSVPYVFCYFLGKNVWNRKCAQRLAREKGCKIVALVHLDEYVAFDETYADYTPYDVGPDDFIRLVRNASYVCTDSFHGTVFSVLFSKSFFSFRRHEDVGSQSTNSRLDSLLDRLGLECRIISTPDQFNAEIGHEIDFDVVDAKLARFRMQSERFFDEALGRDLV